MVVKVQPKPIPENINHVIRLIRYLGVYHGVRASTTNKQGAYTRSYWSMFFTVYSLLVYGTMLSKFGNMIKYDYPSNIIVMMKKLYVYGNMAAMAYGFVKCHISYKNEVKIMKAIEEIDDDLHSIGLAHELSRSNRNVKMAVFSVLFVEYFLFYFVSTVISYKWVSAKYMDWVMVQTNFPISMSSAAKCQFFICTVVLRRRAELLNDYLDRTIKKCSSVQEHLTALDEKILFALKIHKKIVDVARDVNSLFGVMILIHSILTFGLLLSDGYLVVYNLTVGRDPNIDYTLYSASRLIVFNLIELVLGMRSASLLCKLVNSTKKILFNLKMDPSDDVTRNMIMVLVFKLEYDKLIMTAAGLFEMNLAFVYSMFGSAATYLLIMLQFDVDALNKSTLQIQSNTTVV